MIAGELHLGFVEEVVDEPDAWRLAELCNTVGEVGRGHRRLSTEGGEEKSHAAVVDYWTSPLALLQDDRGGLPALVSHAWLARYLAC